MADPEIGYPSMRAPLRRVTHQLLDGIRQDPVRPIYPNELLVCALAHPPKRCHATRGIHDWPILSAYTLRQRQELVGSERAGGNGAASTTTRRLWVWNYRVDEGPGLSRRFCTEGHNAVWKRAADGGLKSGSRQIMF